ncbi:MAG: porin family protein [Leadbetterella sp.]
MSFRYFIIFCFLLVKTTQAQYKPKTFEFGPKVGLNVNGLNTKSLDTTTEYKKKIDANYSLGFFTRINIGTKLCFQQEFTYQGKGGRISEPNTLSGKYAYKYFSVPLLLQFTPTKQVYLEAGPEFNFTTNKNFKKANASIFGPKVSTDHSMIVGLRFNMLDFLSLININVRYIQGFSNQEEGRLYLSKSKVDFRNRTFQLSANFALSEHLSWKKKYGPKKKK